MQRASRAVRLAIAALVLPFAAASLPAGEAAAPEKAAIAPKEAIHLFDGKDMSRLYTSLKDTKREDPRKVFTVHDGLLHISGDGFGGVVTKEAYRDYHTVLEFKWGTKTFGERKATAKDSGIMFHCTGPEDAFAGIWPESFQAQLMNGATGDLYVVKAQGPVALSLQAEVETRDGGTWWKKGAPRKEFKTGGINWLGKDPGWKNVIGFRGKGDVESPDGEWTRVEVICEGDKVAIKVNDVLINEAFELKPSAGKLLVQCEGAELFLRRWDLYPVGKAPALPPMRPAR